jgi:hypothetical protein
MWFPLRFRPFPRKFQGRRCNRRLESSRGSSRESQFDRFFLFYDINSLFSVLSIPSISRPFLLMLESLLSVTTPQWHLCHCALSAFRTATLFLFACLPHHTHSRVISAGQLTAKFTLSLTARYTREALRLQRARTTQREFTTFLRALPAAVVLLAPSSSLS